MYANINNPANFQLQDFAQFGFRVITTDFIPVPGEQYRTLYVLQDAVVTATTQKGDDITSKAILAGTLLHGLFNSVSITSGRVLAYAAGRVTAEEIIALYEAYVVALGGTIENTQCAIDTLNDTGVDFFADASLVMIPDGYGTGVVYGQRPLTSDSQLTFTRASTATRVGPDGAIAVVGSNVPRIDYTGGGCGKLLLEPQRTNLLLYSEEFDDAAWSKTGVGVTANNSTSPDGNTNADKLFNSVGTSGFASQTISLVSSTIYSGSVFVKNAGRDGLFVFFSGSGGSASCTFDLTTLTTTPSGGVTAKIEDYGGGWYRCSVVFTATSTGASAFRIYPTLTTGDGTSGILIYGAQIEAGSYATSYIPTLGSTVTRLADACSKTGIASLIGQTEGTVFVEAEFTSDYDLNNVLMNLSDGVGSSNLIYINRSIGKLEFFVQNASLTQMLYLTPTILSAGVHKMALGYKANDFVVYIDGVLAHTDTSGSVPACSKLNLGSYWNASNPYNNGVSQALLFKTRLSNEQLQKLTSL
jgi:hypothetical protein